MNSSNSFHSGGAGGPVQHAGCGKRAVGRQIFVRFTSKDQDPVLARRPGELSQLERGGVVPKRAGHRLPPEADEEGQELQAALRMSIEPTAPSVGARVKLHSLQQKPEHNGVDAPRFCYNSVW
jgi:hypothetical protein